MHPLPEGRRQSTIRETLDFGQNGRDEYEVTSGEESASKVPRIGALVSEELRGGGAENRGGGDHGSGERRDDIAKAGAEHRIPIGCEDVFGDRLNIFVQEDTEEEVLVEGEPERYGGRDHRYEVQNRHYRVLGRSGRLDYT